MNPKHEVPMVEMKPGDFISIPAFKNHHVDWMKPYEPNPWLSVRYGGASRANS